MDSSLRFTLDDLKFDSFDTMPDDVNTVEALSCTDCTLYTCGLTDYVEPTGTNFTNPCKTCPLPTDEFDDDDEEN